MIKPLLTFALAAALVPAASAQADTDPGGQSAPLPAPSAVDDSDGGPGAPLPAATDIDDTDASAPSGMAIDRVSGFEPALADGRDPNEPMLRVEPVAPRRDDAETNGRDPDEPVAMDARASYDGPLSDGREGGAAPAASEAPAEPVSAKTQTPRTDLEVSPVMPNPVRGRAALTFASPADGAVTVVVYDLTGRRVVTAFDDFVQAGAEVRVELDLSDVAAGTYVAVLDIGRDRLSRTFQVVR